MSQLSESYISPFPAVDVATNKTPSGKTTDEEPDQRSDQAKNIQFSDVSETNYSTVNFSSILNRDVEQRLDFEHKQNFQTIGGQGKILAGIVRRQKYRQQRLRESHNQEVAISETSFNTQFSQENFEAARTAFAAASTFQQPDVAVLRLNPQQSEHNFMRRMNDPKNQIHLQLQQFSRPAPQSHQIHIESNTDIRIPRSTSLQPNSYRPTHMLSQLPPNQIGATARHVSNANDIVQDLLSQSRLNNAGNISLTTSFPTHEYASNLPSIPLFDPRSYSNPPTPGFNLKAINAIDILTKNRPIETNWSLRQLETQQRVTEFQLERAARISIIQRLQRSAHYSTNEVNFLRSLEQHTLRNQQGEVNLPTEVDRLTSIDNPYAFHSVAPLQQQRKATEKDSSEPTMISSTVMIYSESDVYHLSKYQCLIRRQLEFFASRPEDTTFSVQGRKKHIRIGQVGIQCRHCCHLPHRLRGRGAVYYPVKLSGVYQVVQNMATVHLIQHCNEIPSEIRDELTSLRGNREDSATGGGKYYWTSKCSDAGVMEKEDGLFFLNT
jgi:hypothetical protein